MQIELIGCTSSGKSTLLAAIQSASRESNMPVITSENFIMKQAGLANIRQKHLRLIVTNMLPLLVAALTVSRYRQFRRFMTKTIFSTPIPLWEKLHLYRNALKRIGVYEIIRRRDNDQQLILVDEGTVHAANIIFINAAEDSPAPDTQQFLTLVPLPDALVYVKQDIFKLVQRTRERGHKRLPDISLPTVHNFIEKTVVLFDEIVADERIRPCLQIIESDLTLSGSQHSNFISLRRILQDAIDRHPYRPQTAKTMMIKE